MWLGGTPLLEPVLDASHNREDPDPFVDRLTMAIRAQRGDEGALAVLAKTLDNPETQHDTLRVLQIVPLPQLESEVQAVRTQGDIERAWAARKALDKMREERGERVDTNGATIPFDEPAESDPGGPIRYSRDGDAVAIGNARVPRRQWEGTRSGSPKTWMAAVPGFSSEEPSDEITLSFELRDGDDHLHASGGDAVLLFDTDTEAETGGLCAIATVVPRGEVQDPNLLWLTDPVIRRQPTWSSPSSV